MTSGSGCNRDRQPRPALDDASEGGDRIAGVSREQVLRELLDEAHARIRALQDAIEQLRQRLERDP